MTGDYKTTPCIVEVSGGTTLGIFSGLAVWSLGLGAEGFVYIKRPPTKHPASQSETGVAPDSVCMTRLPCNSGKDVICFLKESSFVDPTVLQDLYQHVWKPLALNPKPVQTLPLLPSTPHPLPKHHTLNPREDDLLSAGSPKP